MDSHSIEINAVKQKLPISYAGFVPQTISFLAGIEVTNLIECASYLLLSGILKHVIGVIFHYLEHH